MNLENLRNIMMFKTVKDEYINKNIKNFLEYIESDLSLSSELANIFTKLNFVSEVLATPKLKNNKKDQIEVGNYLKELGDRLIKHANEHIETLEDDEDSSKMKKEVRKEIDDFLDEIFGGK